MVGIWWIWFELNSTLMWQAYFKSRAIDILQGPMANVGLLLLPVSDAFELKEI